MKQSSNVIALEYANADPTYVTKTNVRLLPFYLSLRRMPYGLTIFT